MRKVTKYTEAIKTAVMSKALLPNAPGVVELSNEFNIPSSTIRTWMHNMHKSKGTTNPISHRPNDKSSVDKLQAVLDTLGKTDEELSAYCRTQGIYSNHVDTWKQQMLDGLSFKKQKSINTRESKAENKAIQDELRQLKSELNRKNNALAELTALLILKKKADLLWGVDEDV